MILPRSESEKRVVNEDHPGLEESMKKSDDDFYRYNSARILSNRREMYICRNI